MSAHPASYVLAMIGGPKHAYSRGDLLAAERAGILACVHCATLTHEGDLTPEGECGRCR